MLSVEINSFARLLLGSLPMGWAFGVVNLFAGNPCSICSSLDVAEGKGDLKRNMEQVFETMLDPGLFDGRLCLFALGFRCRGSKCSILMLHPNSMAQIS